MINKLLNSNLFLLAVEPTGLILAAVLCVAIQPQRWLTQLEYSFAKLASHRYWSIGVVALAVVLGRLALLPIFPAPVPGVHDEFSYLLSGATFASGRLVNPPSPLWPVFESFHILQRPFYVSMYPVAPGLFLAVGYLLGSPWFGVLLGVSIFCGAVTWALQGWVTSPWALLGGLLAVIKFGLVCYWVDSYWGGAVSALGGALVVGSVPRLLTRTTSRDALLLACGLLLLANSRPYEGLLVAIAMALWFAFQVFKRRSEWTWSRSVSLGVPLLSVLLIGGILMGSYFRAATGDAITMPYVKYAEEYSITPVFVWQHLRAEPVFHNSVMRRYYENELPEYSRARTLKGWTGEVYRKLSSFCMFYLWPGLLLIAMTLPKVLATIEGRLSLLVIAFVMVGISVEVWPMMLHYPSPATVAALLLLICSIRAIRSFRLGFHRVGIGLSRAPAFLCATALSLRIAAAYTGTPIPEHGLISFLTVAPGNLSRQHIIALLSERPGNHLVIVRYGAGHDISHEWVYNSPSPSTARVIWARDLGDASTQNLIHSFAGRTPWLLEPDRNPPTLVPYSTANNSRSSLR